MPKKQKLYFETEETTIVRKKGWIEIETDYTQFYTNIAPFLWKLNDKWSIRYLFYLVPKTNKDNFIFHNKKVIEDFQNELLKNKIEVPSAKTIKDAFTELIKNSIVIKYGVGSYQLNPLFLWTTDTDDRKKMIIDMKKKNDLLSKVNDYEEEIIYLEPKQKEEKALK